MTSGFLVLLGALSGCGPGARSAPAPVAGGTVAVPAAAPASQPAAQGGPASQPAAAAPVGWQNPGGMWLPSQILELAGTLKALGLEILPAALADPLRAPLGAVVSLGGCTASFVSPDGLIATNHHCVQEALQYNSTPTENLLEIGFLAKTLAEERWAGPTAHAYVAIKISDVTAQMTGGLAALPDDKARHDALEQREKGLLASCERDRPELRCRVASTFGGGHWELTEQLDIRDVRLVYAPPRSVGNFGSEIDNWTWPRHTGDFAFLRAYVAADGRPADHVAGNRPYQPNLHLALATAPLKSGDLVLVAGYPGSTSRLATAAETEDAASWSMPRTIHLNEQKLALLEELTRGRPDLAIKAEPRRRSLANVLKKYGGVVRTLEAGVLAEKKAEDARLLSWIDAEPARSAKYRPALERIEALDAERRRTRAADAAMTDLVSGSRLLEQAVTLIRLAEERARPDAQRRLAYQERNWSRLERAGQVLQKSYARELDRALLKLVLERALALPPADRPPALGLILGPKPTAAGIDAALARLYATTKLEDPATRAALFRTATPARLRASNDPFIRLALKLVPDIKAREARLDAHEGGMALARPLYIEARRELAGTLVAPDANGTLRITFGRVMPSPRGGRSFTTVSELAAKATGEKPFDAPPALLDAIQRKAGAGRASAEVGDVPVDFMSDTDITNGNSGSPTLNARGQLVGLAFDGTLDTVASDWLYLRDVTRTIHVDVRYVLWYLEEVDGADRLLEELGARRGR